MKSYSAARSGAFVYVRAHGLANMKTAPVLDAFLRTELADGAQEVCIDLSQCTGMDSTFMGTLVGFAQLLAEVEGRLVIVNPGDSNMRLLTTLGITAVVTVLDTDDLAETADLNLEPLDCEPAQSASARMSMIRRAHENLLKLKDENKAKFAPFLAALNADIKRHESDLLEEDTGQA